MIDDEDHLGLPFWGVSCAAHEDPYGILVIISTLTRFCKHRLFSNIGQFFSVAQKLLHSSLEKLFVSLRLESHYYWSPLLGT